MPDTMEVKRLAEIVAKRLRAGESFVEVTRQVIRKEGVPKDERKEMLTAIGTELSAHRHVGEAKRRPNVSKEPPKPQREQIGFGFGERRPGEKKIRPPRRRHL